MGSSLRRLTLDVDLRAGATVALDQRTSHYVTRVLRLAEGCEVEAVDRTGTMWRGSLRWVAGQPTFAADAVVAAGLEEPTVRLVAALIKGERWEMLLEKATELGATEIVALASERSVVRIPEDRLAGRLERWRRICDQATRQSHRAGRVIVLGPIGLEAAVASAAGTLLLVDEESPGAPWPVEAWTGPLTLLVGPEGGFTDSERELVLGSGGRSVGLGSTRLRAETATVVALAALRLRREGLL